MNGVEVSAVLERIAERWRTTVFGPDDRAAWATVLADVDETTARDALRRLHMERPHHRPSVDTFVERVHAIEFPTRLSPAQIERNLAGLATLRAAWESRHTTMIEQENEGF